MCEDRPLAAAPRSEEPDPGKDREARWRLRSIIEGTNVGSWEWNVQTGETRFNERWAEIIGYRLEELQPVSIETWMTFAKPEDLEGSDRLLERHFAGELEYYDIECRMRHRDGHWVWVHDRGRVFSWTADGKPEWMFGTHQDITARKNAEAELRRSLARLAKAESLAALGSWEYDPAEDRLSGSAGLASLLGVDLVPRDADRDWFLSFVPEPERTRVADRLGDRSGAARVEHALVPRSGEEARRVETQWARHVRDDGTRLYIGTVHDITGRRAAEEERVALERQLLQAQKLESLGVLAGGIAHDFNNILGVIRGYADLAHLESDDRPEVQAYLAEVIDGVERATLLTRQMLAYSGRGNVVIVPVDLSELVEEAGERLQASGAGRIAIRLITGEGRTTMDGDPAQLRQVIRNLVSNAVDALGDGPGMVEIRTGHMEWDGDTPPEGLRLLTEGFPRPRPGSCVFLEVTDDGVGMDDSVQHRFLEPFFSTRFHGRGLGMSAVQGILRAHAGGLMLDSAPGRGTRIRIFFPAAAGAPGGASDPGPDGMGRGATAPSPTLSSS